MSAHRPKLGFLWPRIARGGAIQVLAAGAVGHAGVGDGRLIPVLILDCSSRPDVAEFIAVHKNFPPGDVTSQWGADRFDDNIVQLLLVFRKPSEISVIIEMTMSEYAGAIDQIIQARGLYLMSGASGETVSKMIEEKRDIILVEVPPTTVFPNWDRKLLRHARGLFRSTGMSRGSTKKAAAQYIENWRKFGKQRMGDAVGGDQKPDNSRASPS